MRIAFADAFYWLALLDPRDAHHAAANSALRNRGIDRLVTTDGVFTELLAAMSGRGAPTRQKAVAVVRGLLDNPKVEVLPQTRESFLSGLRLYEARTDKEYSLVDCISMEIMRERGISEVLTRDHHFAQGGFTLLL